MRWGMAVAALLVAAGAGGLVYAPENKAAIKVVVLVAGVVIGFCVPPKRM